jgi:siroheme synthase-like protein
MTMNEPRVLLPVFLDLRDKVVLVVGAGAVAARKLEELTAMKARLRVVAPLATPEIEARASAGELTLERREFDERDVDGAWLVLASTDDADAQRRVAEACEKARIFCIAVDDPPNASAYGGGVLRRGPVTISISTSGEAPALARLLREVLEQVLPDEGFVDAARALREKWKTDKTPMGSRFGELVQAFKERSSPKP